MDNNKNTDVETFRHLLKSQEFSTFDNELKDIILNSFEITVNKPENFCTMKKILGNESGNISLYITFIVVAMLIIVGLIYILLPPEYKQTTNVEFWKVLCPVVTGALGYIFGAHTHI